MSAKKKSGGLATAGLAGLVLSKTPAGRVVTGVIVARRVWKDPRVQKVRRRVQDRLLKSAQRTAAKNAKNAKR